MKLLISLLAFTIILHNIAIADDILPPCKSQGCFVIAEKIFLKETTEPQGLKAHTGSFTITIPPNITSIGLGVTITAFRYESAPHIMISTETAENFRLRELTTKPVTISDAIEIIFTKTPKDRDITGKNEKELWDTLMWIKNGLMERPNKAYIYENGGLKIYHIPNSGGFYNNVAWAIDSEHPNSALKLESNLDENNFKKMLFSIYIRKTKEN